MKYSNLVSQRSEDVQVVFSPSLSNCMTYGFKLDAAHEAFAAFQLFVKPGAYSIARDCPEWSTKETGALSLNALLLQVKTH